MVINSKALDAIKSSYQQESDFDTMLQTNEVNAEPDQACS